MSIFKPTYLYIKTHNKTGLKYFGKTVKDPYKYGGSGVYWRKHLKKYGDDVTTEIYGYYNDASLCKQAAIDFSLQHNIVESETWANLRIEELDGGDASKTEGFKRWVSSPEATEMRKNWKWWNNGLKDFRGIAPPSGDYIRGRLAFNNVGAKMGSDIQREKRWVNNGIHDFMLHKDIDPPEGYKVGRLYSKAFAGGQGRHSAKGTHWWNNGKDCKMTSECPGQGWVRGRLRRVS